MLPGPQMMGKEVEQRRSRLGVMELGLGGHREGMPKASRCTGQIMEREDDGEGVGSQVRGLS